jgi:hypothetical protein
MIVKEVGFILINTAFVSVKLSFSTTLCSLQIAGSYLGLGFNICKR